MVSPANIPAPNLLSRGFLRLGSFPALRFLLLALAFTLVAIAAEQFAAPILHSSSPLWATSEWLLHIRSNSNNTNQCLAKRFGILLPLWRVEAVIGAHGEWNSA